MPASQALLVTAICASLGVGLVMALPIAMRQQLARHLGGDDRLAGATGVVFLLAMIPIYPLVGWLVDTWGVQESLTIGCLGTAVGLASLALSRHLRQALGAAAVLGAAVALLHTASAALMPAGFFPDRPATAACLGYGLIGLTSGLALILLPWLERNLGFRRGVLVLALVYLVPAGAAGLTAPADFPLPKPSTHATAILSEPGLWLAGLVALLYLPLEALIFSHGRAYLEEVCIRPATVPLALGGYWLAFLAGRLLMAVALPVLVPWLMVIWILLAAAVLGNLSGSYRPAGATWGFCLLGACLGPIFPCLVGLGFLRYPEHLGLFFGVVMALGSIGSLLWQPLLQLYARGHSVRLTLRLGMVVALATIVPALALCLVL
jgi:fucose permease